MSNQIFTVVTLTARDGQFDALKEVVKELARATRNEPGAQEYLIIEDAATPNTVFSIEKWENETEEAKHWEMPHLKEALAKMEPLLGAAPVVRKGKLLI